MARIADDRLTVAAVAVAAMVAATAAHEAVGHGSVCLALGGTITRLTSVYFQCSARNTWVAAGGPAGNLLAALLAWIALGRMNPGAARTRLFAVLVLAISAYWFAGYLLYSALKNDGDLYFVAVDLVGRPSVAERLAAGVVGVVLYGQAMRAVGGAASAFAGDGDPARPSRLLRLSWFAAAICACIASLFYAPDRMAATHQAVLEVGLAALPLLAHPFIRPTAGPVAAPVSRSWPWIGGSLLVFAIFVMTLGRGLP